MTKTLMQQLLERQNNHLWRRRICIDYRNKQHSQYTGKNYLSFINNDYLGLATHSNIINALKKGAKKYGVGSSASSLLGGYYRVHQQLEEAIATFTGFKRSLIFSTGYLANFAVITTLIKKQDIIFEHRCNHASLLDATRFTGASIKRFNNIAQLTQQLSQSTQIHKWIITDAVFSMDGTIAPVPELILLAKIYQAKIIIDDAHGIGVLGPNGGGTLQHYQIDTHDEHLILTGTFGKAFGGQGAFVCANETIIEYLLQFARGFIYSTALSPALAQANLASLILIKKQNWRRIYLNQLIDQLSDMAKNSLINFQPSITPIQTILIKDNFKTLNVADQLQQQKILVAAIRPPTVAVNSARLRISLSVRHTKKNIEDLLKHLSQLL